jgi:pimeloyl-ACP methyl ester carboxylesterase
MKRRWKVLIAVVIGIAILLAVNTIVVDEQTKSAEITIEGGELLKLPGGVVQVMDEGPTSASDEATGAPIVLIHCYACSLHWWDHIAPALAENHRVILIDLLGFGGSEKPTSGYSMENQAQLVAAALDRLDAQGAVVVGHSTGFDVATSLAQQASQLVDRLVDIDEAPDDSLEKLPFIAKLGYVPVIGEAVWRLTPSFAIKQGFESAFAPGYDLADGFNDPDQVVHDFRAMTFSSYKDSQSEQNDFVEQEPLDERVSAATVPLMVIFGTEDQIWKDPAEAAQGYSDVPGVRVEMVKGAGHSPNVEQPARTARLILDWAAGATVAPAHNKRARKHKR